MSQRHRVASRAGENRRSNKRELCVTTRSGPGRGQHTASAKQVRTIRSGRFIEDDEEVGSDGAVQNSDAAPSSKTPSAMPGTGSVLEVNSTDEGRNSPANQSDHESEEVDERMVDTINTSHKVGRSFPLYPTYRYIISVI